MIYDMIRYMIYDTIRYVSQLQLGKHPVTVGKYTFTHKQRIE